MNTIDCESRFRTIHENVLSSKWYAYYQQILLYSSDLVLQVKGGFVIELDNIKYIETYNLYLMIKGMQESIDINISIPDWFKDFSNEILSYLDSLFTSIIYNPYADEFRQPKDEHYSAWLLFDMYHELQKIERKYL